MYKIKWYSKQNLQYKQPPTLKRWITLSKAFLKSLLKALQFDVNTISLFYLHVNFYSPLSYLLSNYWNFPQVKSLLKSFTNSFHPLPIPFFFLIFGNYLLIDSNNWVLIIIFSLNNALFSFHLLLVPVLSRSVFVRPLMHINI